MTADPRSAANIATLLPAARGKALEWLARCRAEGIDVKVVCGTRTYAEQAEIFAKGRTKPGPMVTNARPGYSWHNFGVAWDFAVFDGRGRPVWDGPEVERCGRIGEAMGLEWGGSWKSFRDPVHLQVRTGLTLAGARRLVAEGKWPKD